jgi:hypothetical protein
VGGGDKSNVRSKLCVGLFQPKICPNSSWVIWVLGYFFSQEEQQQMELQFLIKQVWVAFLN